MTAVLLVDDDASSRVVLAVLLEDEGLEVDTAASFAAAAGKLAAAGARYDVVILDENLGDGRGSDLLPALRARFPRARALLLSGDVPSGGLGPPAGAAHAFDAALPKGVEFPEILAAIGRLLASAPPA